MTKPQVIYKLHCRNGVCNVGFILLLQNPIWVMEVAHTVGRKYIFYPTFDDFWNDIWMIVHMIVWMIIWIIIWTIF